MAIEPRNSRLPVKREPSPPPSIWRAAAPVVVRGAALVAAGLIGEWALRSAARKAVSVPFGRKKPAQPLPAKREEGVPKGIVAISETVVMRRVIVRGR